ncbi:MAG: Tetraacyldisaccharide 4'-kinase [Owenweeksia sp. TMED14]|nr:MAG: Tetraacyldisaccharide 4'-kinase [Owenweeksia sp. TMED14]
MNWSNPYRFLKFLTPFYLVGLQFHRLIYDWKILVPYIPHQATLILGNLHSGGTGKTPLAIWILKKLEREIPKIAYVSRGYGRKDWKTKVVQTTSSVADVGDEARMIRAKFKNSNISIIVAKKRRTAFPLIPINAPVILDDAYQHWDLKAPLSVLVCPYGKWYTDAQILPAGPLRESPSGAERASAIVVTRCPGEIDEYDRLKIRKKLNINKNQKLFCAQENMGKPNAEFNSPLWTGKEMALVISGIGEPDSYYTHVRNSDFFNNDGNAVGFLRFNDHVPWNKKNILKVKNTANSVHCDSIIMTEKDISRLDKLPEEWSSFTIYSIPHKLNFGNDENIFLSWLKDQWKAHGYRLPLQL